MPPAPTPWHKVKMENVSVDAFIIRSKDPKSGALFSVLGEANAAFIVKACNLHEELISAVKGFLSERDNRVPDLALKAHYVAKLRAVLKKAGEAA